MAHFLTECVTKFIRGFFSFFAYMYIEGGDNVTEKEIINQIQSRDERGLNNLITYYSPLIKYVIAPILPNEEDREECLSDTLMRIWDKIHLFDEAKGSWKAYITAIARNCALSRARCFRPNVSEELTDSIPSPRSSPEETLLKKEAQQKLLSALNTLPHKDKALFYRKYYYLQSTAQIASETGSSVRAVEGRLYRIKKRLQKMLGGEFNE